MKRAKILILFLATLTTGVFGEASNLKVQAIKAFDQYVEQQETRFAQQHRSTMGFLSLPKDQQEITRLRNGELVIHKNDARVSAPGTMVHHWTGTVFIAGAKATDYLRLMQDYDHLALYYKPQVARSRLLEHSGDRFRVAMRLRQHHVITVVLDTQYDIVYGMLNTTHGYCISRSIEVSEIADHDTDHEHVIAQGKDHGFLWRLNSYWTFVEQPDGLLLQCEAISLTRDVPHGLNWLVGPFVQSIPRESLEFTLTATRNALISRRTHGN